MASARVPSWVWIGVGGVGLFAAYSLLVARQAAALPPGTPAPGPLPGPMPGTPTGGPPPIFYPESGMQAPSVESGSEFIARVANLSESARNREVLAAVAAGKYPRSLTSFKPISTTYAGHTGTFYVSPDYVAVGTDADAVRVPMFPATAQRIADQLGAVLPTPKMVDLIQQQADVKIAFQPLAPAAGQSRASSVLVRQHDATADARIAGRTGVVSGHKKDIVVGNLQARSPGKVVIYGGFYGDGSRVQPLSAAHSASYEDYSHGVRLVARSMVVDGRQMRVDDVLRDPALAGLLNSDGTVAVARYAV